MTEPTVPHRFEITVELPGTAEQVWEAIASADGISAWMMPTDLEEREGGALTFHMGEISSKGVVTGWDPPRRFAYEEPDWAELAGKAGEAVTPMATEFVVEATAGGTCVVRVVSSAFGTGADWEDEFWTEMGKGWAPQFDILRLYLTHFPGQRVTPLSVELELPIGQPAAWAALAGELGIRRVGQRVEVRGLTGQVEQLTGDRALIRLDGGVPGFLTLRTMGDDTQTWCGANAQLFGAGAPAYVAAEEASWRSWVEGIGVQTIV